MMNIAVTNNVVIFIGGCGNYRGRLRTYSSTGPASRKSPPILCASST